MSKTLLLIVGLLIAFGAAGAFYLRVADDPNAAQRYDWVLQKIGAREEAPEEPVPPAADVEKRSADGSRTRSLSPDALSERRAARRERIEQREQLELFKLGLDFMNLVVGLLGIYLALRGVGGTSQRQDS